MLHAAIVGVGGLLVWLSAPQLRRELRSRAPAPTR